MSSLYNSASTQEYGLTSLPADQSKAEPSNPNPGPVDANTLKVPQSALAKRVDAYAKRMLGEVAYRHSLRVWSYGVAIARECFPEWKVEEGSKLEETWFCTAMLHDIGTTDEHIGATRLSYEFWAGVKALELLQEGSGDASAPREQAESVCEAIIRHQDVQDKGNITLVTRLIHLGTLLDNIGAGKELVHEKTIENVNAKYDRTGWRGCFRDVVVKEKDLKPYAMVSRIEGFEQAIEGNKVSATKEG